MQHPDFEKKVSDEFDATWSTSGKDQSYALAFRCDIAKALLAAEPDDVQDRLEQEAVEQHKKALAAHNLALLAKPSDDPEHQQQYVPIFYLIPSKLTFITELGTCWQQSFSRSLMAFGLIQAIRFG